MQNTLTLTYVVTVCCYIGLGYAGFIILCLCCLRKGSRVIEAAEPYFGEQAKTV
uniref:Uncharacterized protein n=1 Tax=Anguilla anguilla TaxID=7936 RepID=A0A0E9SXH1_ANGAN